MADVKKQERDFTPEVDALISEASNSAKVRPSILSIYINLLFESLQGGGLQEAIDRLLALEKQTRNVS